jgi:hypothetical protein
MVALGNRRQIGRGPRHSGDRLAVELEDEGNESGDGSGDKDVRTGCNSTQHWQLSSSCSPAWMKPPCKTSSPTQGSQSISCWAFSSTRATPSLAASSLSVARFHTWLSGLQGYERFSE